MADQPASSSHSASPAREESPRPIVIQQPSSRIWLTRILVLLLVISLLFNVGLFARYGEYYGIGEGPREKFHSGDRDVAVKIAVIEINGTIMPPFTGRILKAIEKARKDDDVKGVILSVDSPGGLVADSDMIYHELVRLREKKPITVMMERMAASGGYYVAMGAGTEGRIFAQPSTWTGSIGVIIPHYDVSGLAEKIGVRSDPLKTGEFKDALSPFKELDEAERALWTEIMNESFERFVSIIAENRAGLDEAAVKEIATGQVYTAQQALEKKMIDAIGYEEDVIADLKQQLDLDEVRVVRYESPPSLLDVLTGSAEANTPQAHWRAVLELGVPKAMYYCSGIPELGGLATPRR